MKNFALIIVATAAAVALSACATTPKTQTCPDGSIVGIPSASAAATSGDLRGWHDGSGRLDLPAATTPAAAAATGAPFRRTRLSPTGPAEAPAPLFLRGPSLFNDGRAWTS